ncbi:MAG: cytochrome c, class I [Cycloclasticus sp. symbiont of Poecilosclerida sp. N]|nr:MAG: cytochrome c, class I [Cycloclasticus sp. symbiont of Poecilosclerida sp. N]
MSEDKAILNDIGKVLGVLVLVAVIISIIAINLVDEDTFSMTALKEKKVLNRIKPLGVVATTIAEAKAASPQLDDATPENLAPMTAEEVYNRACMACHATGAADAPITGDVKVWESRISQGSDVLFEHATKGFKGMPPRGGSPQLSDEEMKAAIDFMVMKSQ